MSLYTRRREGTFSQGTGAVFPAFWGLETKAGPGVLAPAVFQFKIINMPLWQTWGQPALSTISPQIQDV